ncbi:hypothetical protein JCM8097_004537 [Rhodosporidiobolus ruineniae]
MSRPPMNLVFPDRTAAGISKDANGERVVAASRRPDGSIRKEIKIRPGFTPVEDVLRYRTRGAIEAEQRRAVKGAVPGLTPPAATAQVQAALSGMSRAQKKNAKRKEKRHDEPAGGAAGSGDAGRSAKKEEEEDVPDSWDADEDEEGEEATPKPASPALPPPVPPISAAPPTPAAAGETAEEKEKRARAVKKKLRQAEQLRDRPSSDLSPSERDKVDRIAELEAELEKLTV